MTIEGHTGLFSYETEKTRVRTPKGTVTILGEGMILSFFGAQDLAVRGRVHQILLDGEQPSYLTWDLETETLPLGGAWAPVRLRRETYWETAAERTPRNAEEVKKECAAAALRLVSEAVSGDETVDKWINFSMIEGDAVRAEAVAEVRRDIGRFVKR